MRDQIYTEIDLKCDYCHKSVGFNSLLVKTITEDHDLDICLECLAKKIDHAKIEEPIEPAKICNPRVPMPRKRKKK